jgi:hypothetical protein
VALVALPQLRQVDSLSFGSFAIATSVVLRQCGQTIGSVGSRALIAPAAPRPRHDTAAPPAPSDREVARSRAPSHVGNSAIAALRSL